jgi:hypothetical protein
MGTEGDSFLAMEYERARASNNDSFPGQAARYVRHDQGMRG